MAIAEAVEFKYVDIEGEKMVVEKDILQLGVKEKSLEEQEKKGIVGILKTGPKTPELGKFLCISPHEIEGSNQYISLNFTGPPGSASGLYDSLFFWMLKQDWNVEKVDESIEVSPTHAQYYQLTLAQKQALEGTIKTGLASAAQAVADFELINHDLRKYKEILDYFTRKDEHALKAMFIDQVDIHTGDGISLRSIVMRWPTIIHDFMRVRKEDDIEPKKLGVSQAECVILKTKFKLYQEWKNLFGTAAKERYERLKGLVESRKSTIEEYRKWLKPYITKFKMMKLGHETEGGRLGTLRAFYDLTGQASFSNSIKIWAWKPFRTAEARKPTAETTDKFVIHPYDRYVRETIILNDKIGLAKIYPWLKNKIDAGKAKKLKIVEQGIISAGEATVADEMIDSILENDWNLGKRLDPTRLYYVFMTFDIIRVGKRAPDFEFEDITFDIKTFLLSQNILLVKYLELKCREKEFEKSIDILLGLKSEEGEIAELVKKEYPELFGAKPEQKQTIVTEFGDALKSMSAALRSLAGSFSVVSKIFGKFVRPGPYENTFGERITQYYLRPMGRDYFGAITGFLKTKMGVE